jgi:isocitrate dehydrogenase
MMLEYMGWNEAAERINHALENSFSEGRATADLARFMQNGVALGTREFAAELVARMA